MQSKKAVFAKFYDITLTDADGKEMEPSAPVDVEIKFADKLAKELKAEDAAKVSVIHFVKDEKTGKVSAEVLGTDEDTNNNGVAVTDGESGKTEQISEAKNGETPVELTITDDQLQGVAFTSDSFSVYGVIYTVDFHYGDGEYDFSIAGESSIRLSEIFERLHIDDIDMADVESVEFSDPELIKVEQEDSDWLLTSLKPFDTEETLTITLADGSKITIKVTDAQPTGVVANKPDGAICYMYRNDTNQPISTNSNTNRVPGYYSKLSTAFGQIPSGVSVTILMVVPEYSLTQVGREYNASLRGDCILTTADEIFTASGNSVIKRGSCDNNFFRLENSAYTLTLTNITLDGESREVPALGALIHLYLGKCTLDKGTILQNGNSSAHCGAVDVDGGVLTVDGAIIRNCKTTTFGGAIDIHNHAGTNVTFKSGTIENCSAGTYGGAIHCQRTMTFESGIIRNCTAGSNGGAIQLEDGTIDIGKDAEITGCKANNGGAIYMQAGVLTMKSNGKIDNCTATQKGGAIYFEYNRNDAVTAHFTQDCSITNCSSQTGDVFVDYDSFGSSAQKKNSLQNPNTRLYFSGAPSIPGCIDLTMFTNEEAQYTQNFNNIVNASGVMSNAAVRLLITNGAHDTGGEEFGTTVQAAANSGLMGFINDRNQPFVGWPVTYGQAGTMYWAMPIPVQAKCFVAGDLHDVSNSLGQFAPDKNDADSSISTTSASGLPTSYGKVNSVVNGLNTDGKHQFLYAKIGDTKISSLSYNKSTGSWKYTPVGGTPTDYDKTTPVTLYYYESPVDVTVHYIEKEGSALKEIGSARTLSVNDTGVDIPAVPSGYTKLYAIYGTQAVERASGSTLDITKLYNAWDGLHINAADGDMIATGSDIYVFMYKNPRTLNVKWVKADNTGNLTALDTSQHPESTKNATDAAWLDTAGADVATHDDVEIGNKVYRFRYYALGGETTTTSGFVETELDGFNLKVADDGSGLLFTTDTSATATPHTDIDTIYVVYSELKLVTLSINNKNEGDYSNPDDSFIVTLTLKPEIGTIEDGDTNLSRITGASSWSVANGEATTTFTVDDTNANRLHEFTNIPEGWIYNVSEAVDKGYVVEYSIGDQVVESAQGALNDDTTVNIRNTRGNIVPSGLAMRRHFEIAAVVLALVLAGVLMKLLQLRRRYSAR